MNTFDERISSAVKNWWVSLLLGLLYILIAICLMFTPMASYVALSLLFSVAMFVSGTLEILFAVSNRKHISSWGWYLAGGIIDLILGIYLMASPGLSMTVLPFILAFWLMFRGFSSTGYAMDLKRFGTGNWGWYMAFGILAIICSIAIIWQPGLGVFTLVYMIAYALLIIGIFRVMLSFELRSLHKKRQLRYSKVFSPLEWGFFPTRMGIIPHIYGAFSPPMSKRWGFCFTKYPCLSFFQP